MANDIHVVPGGKKWATTAEDRQTIIKSHETKAAATKHGRALAKERGVNYVIHNSDGTFADHRTPQRTARPKVVHVVPHEEHWDVSDSGRVMSRHYSKYVALQHGKALAKSRNSDLVVHYADGEVQDRFNPRESFRPAVMYLGA